MSGRVLVTGATGFLGSVIARKLVERGLQVHALARPSSDRSVLEGVRITWLSGDLREPESLERAFKKLASQGAFSVVHSGALISYATRDARAQQLTNAVGTRNVLNACLRHSVLRLLHVSSVVAVAHSSVDRVLDETAEFNGAELGVDYVTTKHAAEELVLSHSSELDVVVTCPGAIFGSTSRESSNSAHLLKEIRDGKRFLAAPPGGVMVVGLEDTAEGCVLALERGRRGERYILAESFWTVRKLLSFLSNECGGRAVRWTLPRPLWRAVVLGSRALDFAFSLERVTPQSLTMLGVNWNLDSSKAQRELGWKAEPAEQLLRRTLSELP